MKKSCKEQIAVSEFFSGEKSYTEFALLPRAFTIDMSLPPTATTSISPAFAIFFVLLIWFLSGLKFGEDEKSPIKRCIEKDK